MNNAYSIKIEFSPVYECLVSFYAYVHKKETKNIQFGSGSAWRKQTKQMLPVSFAVELEDERWEVLHRIVLLAAQSPKKETVSQFLDWLEALPAGEMYERLAPWVDSIPLNLGEIRDQTLSLLSRWNEYYFSRVPMKTLQRLKESADYFRNYAKSVDATNLIDEATSGVWIEPTEHLKQIVLVPQVHCAPGTILDFHRGIATVLYPVIDGEIVKDENIRSLLVMTHSLADENRLRILRTLAGKKCALNEIQNEVGLAKSTVHHHVTALRRAGFIRAHYRDSSLAQAYSLRESALEKLPQLLDQFLFNGGDK